MTEPTRKPVTVLVTRRVRPGHEAAFEALTRELLTVADRFPGHLGGHVLRPEGLRSTLYQTLFAFDDQAHLDAWTDSRERHDILDRLLAISEGETGLHILSGLEGWFALPNAPTRKPPPRPKMALVTWMGIFPLVLVLFHTVAPILAPISTTLSIFVITAIVTVAMTWVVMPLLVRLLAKWLYPELRSTAPSDPSSNSPKGSP
ncbi:MAG: hypothetical protein GX458_02330 [Phyllobacteriaceae bacterium]|nr:hypothetical protein [Phyllobacteriaceae bacterium]